MDDPERVLRRRAARSRRSSRRRRRASCASSASPATRIRRSTCTCSRPPTKHGFRFDTVQMPLNVMDAHYKSFEKEVLPRRAREDIGVLGMKPLGSGIILQSGAVERAGVPALRDESLPGRCRSPAATAWACSSRRSRSRSASPPCRPPSAARSWRAPPAPPPTGATRSSRPATQFDGTADAPEVARDRRSRRAVASALR